MNRVPAIFAATVAVSFFACGKPEPAQPEPCTDPATLCTWAGTGEAGYDGDGNHRLESLLYWPIDMTFTRDGVAYVVDWNNHTIRELQDDGTFKTVIGSGFVGDGPPDQSDLQEPGAVGTTIDLNHPTQLLELPSGKLLLVSWHNHKLREYDRDTGRAVVTCGSAPGFEGDGGTARTAKLNQPSQVALAEDGTMYILDMRNQIVRRVAPDSTISTIAGTPGAAGYDGDGGDPLQAMFRFPAGSNPPPGGALALDPQGRIYVSDTLNHVVRRIDLAANTIETFAGTGEAGYGGDGAAATQAQLNNPRDLEVSPDGETLYIADELNHRIRAVDIESGVIKTAAGNGEAGYDGEGRAPAQTSLNRPGGIAFDGDGKLYISDSYNHRIRVFDPKAAP